MTRPKGHGDHGNVGLTPEPDENENLNRVPIPQLASAPLPEFATRTKQRAGQQIQQNRFVIIGAGAIVTALLIFVAISMPHRGGPEKAKNRAAKSKDESAVETSSESSDKSLFPITDSGLPSPKETHQGFLNERDLQRTVVRSASNPSPTGQTNGAGTLGSMPPFGDQAWHAQPYQLGSNAETLDVGKAEREAMEKPSLMYVRKASAGPAEFQTVNDVVPQLGLGLTTGTRLRARLESAASTAVRAPVLAVIEYNYERDGEIIVPAGAKAVGHIRDANRSGYVDLQFDSLLMPDGAFVPITAKLVIYEAFVEGRLEAPKHLARTVHDLYFEPKYEDFKPRTIWSLSNAFTSAFKELQPIPQFKATAKLAEFLESRFSLP